MVLIAIWGAGAIGGTIGAYLIRAGHDVVFVDQDADHVAALNGRGITIEGPIETFTAPARAVLPDQVHGTYDCILLCVKAHHTGDATRALAPHLTYQGCVVSLQNGLNELEISAIVGRSRTMGAFVNFGADYLSPGVVFYGGRGAVVLGELDGASTPRLLSMHRLLQVFEPAAITTDNIMGYLWGKLGYGGLLFATALTNASICEGLGAPAAQPVLTAIASEAVAVAMAQGIEPIGFNGYDPAAFRSGGTGRAASFSAMVTHNAKSTKTHSGIWRDLAIRHRKTEVDAQLGPIVSFGSAHGVPTPAVTGLIAMIHEIEDGKRALDWANLNVLANAVL